MSYRNPQIIKNTVDGAGMGQAIAGALSDVGDAIVTRTKELEAEDLRIAERKALEDAQEFERYKLSLEAGYEEEAAYDKNNSGFQEISKDKWTTSLNAQYD